MGKTKNCGKYKRLWENYGETVMETLGIMGELWRLKECENHKKLWEQRGVGGENGELCV